MYLVTSSGAAQINHQYAAQIGGDAIAVLSTTTLALWLARNLDEAGYGGNAWLRDISRLENSDQLNSAVNPAGVAPRLPSDPMPHDTEVVAWGQFALTPASRLVGVWTMTDRYQTATHFARIFGAALAAAEMAGSWRPVWHILKVLGAVELNLRDPAVHEQYPQQLLNYAAEQTNREIRPPWL